MQNFLKFGFQRVRCSNGWFMCNVLCTRSPTIPIPDEYIRKQDATIFMVFKWLSCLVFKWHLNTGPFGILPFFNHLNTKLVWYSDLLSVFLSQSKNCKFMLTLESWCILVVGGGVLVSRTQPNRLSKYKRFGIIHANP